MTLLHVSRHDYKSAAAHAQLTLDMLSPTEPDRYTLEKNRRMELLAPLLLCMHVAMDGRCHAHAHNTPIVCLMNFQGVSMNSAVCMPAGSYSPVSEMHLPGQRMQHTQLASID